MLAASHRHDSSRVIPPGRALLEESGQMCLIGEGPFVEGVDGPSWSPLRIHPTHFQETP